MFLLEALFFDAEETRPTEQQTDRQTTKEFYEWEKKKKS